MSMFGWMPLLAVTAALAQEAAPFPEEKVNPWLPAWELTARADRLSGSSEPADNFRRAGLQVRLKWSVAWEALNLEAGTRSAMGSDSNGLNAPRWDQRPSNGTQLDLARVELRRLTATTFGTLRLGFQENPLLATQALWDRNLRFLGLGASGGWRSAGGRVEEAGVRFAAGRVRNLLGGDLDLAAGQVVLKVNTGPWSWTAQVARWQLTWDGGPERLLALPGAGAGARQRLTLNAAGASGKWNGPFPVEGRWSGCRNRSNGQDSEEVQALFGSRERVYWPQFTFTWQRLSSTGTLYPVNGDEWWFYRNARGRRLEASLPLPGQWVVSVAWLRQESYRESYPVERKLLTILKRF